MGVASVNLLKTSVNLLKTQLDWLYSQDCCMPDNSSIARNLLLVSEF